MLVFAMGIGAAQQLRVAATDMYPPRMRGLALGFVATGSMVGIALSPLVMALAEMAARRTGAPADRAAVVDAAGAILVGMVLVKFVRPDPKEIGMHLERYYPDYKPPPRLPPESEPV